MRPRIRSIAGTLALAAMTVAFAETIVAATCAPGMMEMAEMAEVADVYGESADAARSPRVILASLHEGEAPRDGDDGRDCPFGPAAAQSCASAASIPSHALATPASPVELATSLFSEPAQLDLLLATALFHPPRA